MRRTCSSLILALTTMAVSAATDHPEPARLDPDGFQGVLAQTGELFISGQPTEAALAQMKSEGVTTVISLRTAREMDNREIVPFDEAAAVEALGMRYVNIPLGGPDTPYTPAAVDRLATVLDQADGKVLLHCTVARRASHLWVAYLIEHQGLPIADAVKHGRAINFGALPLEGLLGRPLTVDYETAP